jgi:vacuolar-type H+-ATPase subunit H
MNTVADALGKLQFEADQKMAEIKALGVQQRAAAQRLDDNLKHEAETRAALQEVNGALTEATRELAEARRTTKQLISDAQARAAQIIVDAHDEAEKFLQQVQTAVAAATTLIKRKQ